jgi:outer membrane protein OmpA-like peptidoglycan-associated protein
MSKRSSYVLGILLTLILGSILQHYLCCGDSGASVGSDDKQALSKIGIFSFSGEDFKYGSKGSFIFLRDEFDHLPISYDSINLGIELLKKHLELHPDQNLSITGYAFSSEGNKSIFPNLGFARANSTKNYFVSKGISKERVFLDGKISNGILSQGDSLLEGVSFVLLRSDTESGLTDYGQLKQEINDNPIHLYFEVGQSTINISENDRSKMGKIIDYLDHVGDSELILTGHTDNTGDRAENFILGEARANFLKSYLINNGVQESMIKTSSKGPDEPIASNSTQEGRSLNRRVTINLF